MVNIGDTAPAFTLRATDKREVSLSEYEGKKTILVFYPGAFTGVCDKEMCAFQDNMTALNAADATVLGISVDSPWANAEFARKYNLEFELLSDLNREAVNAYDAALSVLVALMATFVRTVWSSSSISLASFNTDGWPKTPELSPTTAKSSKRPTLSDRDALLNGGRIMPRFHCCNPRWLGEFPDACS